ncbi:uncharacterized protein K489DRAFT_161714 [Dissoconium aciculare CBS 342.82]|uniref:Uncharacterized protein n=1 Tax=Dissoconium aciculare CBS 342.82 TaxID=1314786 RepID=A0A6J3MC12_9PEZI|nr:uncharacterized protein K489DRAFT_161714 [Dissoconium aciculare CBS 342.82]KAF1825561.1 hypothetical protein K489DRAFT_161714 [Dissoconium aciculare CBS 342.82]
MPCSQSSVITVGVILSVAPTQNIITRDGWVRGACHGGWQNRQTDTNHTHKMPRHIVRHAMRHPAACSLVSNNYMDVTMRTTPRRERERKKGLPPKLQISVHSPFTDVSREWHSFCG